MSQDRLQEPLAGNSYAPESFVCLEDANTCWHASRPASPVEPTVYVRGYATIGKVSLEDEGLVSHLHSVAVKGAPALYSEVPRLNGGWATVIRWPTRELFAAVDRMRTIPLFVYHSGDCFAVGASAADLARRFAVSMTVPSQLRFLLFGYTSGTETLFRHIRGIQSGEIIHFKPDQEDPCTATRYYRAYPLTREANKEHHLVDELASVLGRLFERFRDGYRGEQVLVPLSGGLDSRLVAGMLKRSGIDNCVCFTYGEQSSQEVEIARQVAAALGFPWHKIRYSSDTWARWNRCDTYREYWRYACKGVSKPHVQDFPATMELVDDGILDQDSIVFPGHTGDTISGGQIPIDYPNLLAGTLSVRDAILRRHAQPLWHHPARLFGGGHRHLLEEIDEQAAPPDGTGYDNPVARYEMWHAEQRQARYIINSVRMYEFVGSRWRTLWDYELMDFFMAVPDWFRYGQRLYVDCLRTRVFTDELAPLAAIPVHGHGPLHSLRCLRPPERYVSPRRGQWNALKKRISWQLLKAGRASPSSTKTFENNLAVRLSGLGIADMGMSVEKALDQIGVLSFLEPEVRRTLAPWLSLRLRSVPWLTVHTILTLTEMAREGHS